MWERLSCVRSCDNYGRRHGDMELLLVLVVIPSNFPPFSHSWKQNRSTEGFVKTAEGATQRAERSGEP